jgi:hypothetical protein
MSAAKLMKLTRCRRAPLLTLLLLTSMTSGCGRNSAAPPQNAAPPPASGAPAQDERGEPADSRFIGRVWLSTTPGSPRGSIMIFLPDRTLVQDSCFETFRLSQWGASGNLIRWIEDTLPVEAEITLPDKDQLILRVRGFDRQQSFEAVTPPYVCPDMPR